VGLLAQNFVKDELGLTIATIIDLTVKKFYSSEKITQGKILHNSFFIALLNLLVGFVLRQQCD